MLAVIVILLHNLQKDHMSILQTARIASHLFDLHWDHQATLHLAMRPASFIFLRQLQNHKETLDQNKAISSLLLQVKAHQSPTIASLNQHKVMLPRQLSPHTNLVP